MQGFSIWHILFRMQPRRISLQHVLRNTEPSLARSLLHRCKNFVQIYFLKLMFLAHMATVVFGMSSNQCH